MNEKQAYSSRSGWVAFSNQQGPTRRWNYRGLLGASPSDEGFGWTY
jgi:hypothetical protein